MAPENPLDGVGGAAVDELVLSVDELLFAVTEVLFIVAVVVDTFGFVELWAMTAFFITTFVAAGFGATLLAAGFGATFLVEGDVCAALIGFAAIMAFTGALEIFCWLDSFERSSRTLIGF